MDCYRNNKVFIKFCYLAMVVKNSTPQSVKSSAPPVSVLSTPEVETTTSRIPKKPVVLSNSSPLSELFLLLINIIALC